MGFITLLARERMETESTREGDRTNIDCEPAGQFSGKLVVSMRPLNAKDAIRSIQISSRFPAVHGAPVHLGDPAEIGIKDIMKPEYGDAPRAFHNNEIPVIKLSSG